MSKNEKFKTGGTLINFLSSKRFIAVLLCNLIIVATLASPSGALAASLKQGLDALYGKRVDVARTIQFSLPGGSVDRKVLAWAIAMSGKPGIPSGEIAQIARALSDWPGQSKMRDNSERALARENLSPQKVVSLFGDTAPTTVEGTLLLTEALSILGDKKRAARTISPLWRKWKLNKSLEARILREFSSLLSRTDYKLRMEKQLYDDRLSAALRVAPKAGYSKLANAFVAVRRNRKNASALMKAVPAAHKKEPIYMFAQMKQMRRKKQFRAAASVFAKVPKAGEKRSDPDEWWVQRRIVSRELIDQGDAKLAYRVAAGHTAKSNVNIAEAEFHAGWYALRYLGKPKVALAHFSKIIKASSRPLTQSRGYYWLGRAAEDAGQKAQAKVFYQRAANHSTAYYGQLAAARLGIKNIKVRRAGASSKSRIKFKTRERVQAIKRLEESNYGWLANPIYSELAKQLVDVGELALLSARAERKGNPTLGLRVGKLAHYRGLPVDTLAFPIGAIPKSAKVSGVGLALAYSIARQESTFNTKAVSSAGARGLLQLLPGTAKAMARKRGLPYSRARLTSDPAYNATLGAAYLETQLKRFDGSYILTFAGYNAGPRRAKEWIAKYGDPRGKDVDSIVDWVERIPFTETRNYVMRIMENLQVYKVRTGGRSDIVRDLRLGTPEG